MTRMKHFRLAVRQVSAVPTSTEAQLYVRCACVLLGAAAMVVSCMVSRWSLDEVGSWMAYGRGSVGYCGCASLSTAGMWVWGWLGEHAAAVALLPVWLSVGQVADVCQYNMLCRLYRGVLWAGDL